MQKEIKIIPISSYLYPAFYELTQKTKWGNPMLPLDYNKNLWGQVVCIDNEVIGGWVGTIRGNIPLAKWITKSVYFDSYPVFRTDSFALLYQEKLIDSLKQYASKDNITMLNLTHWVREGQLHVDYVEEVASFVVNLEQGEELLFKNIDSAKQRNVKKASKFDLDILICRGDESIKYLADFQRLREDTQNRAISRNKQASMLLKSNDFFRKLMMQPNAILLLGKYEEHVVSVALLLQSGNTIYYHSGGSDIEANRKTCCSAYMFWKALLCFKNQGLKFFDFGGCPVRPTEEHPAYGVYRFKKGFGGEYIEFIGGKIIINKFKYILLNLVLSQRKLLRLFSTKF